MSDFQLKDSGERQEFITGAVRDTAEGKGRYDLISPIAIRRLAVVLEKGAKKYKSRNWEKGMNLCRFIDSAKRHMDQFLEGNRDEDHLGQAMFNIMGCIHTEEMIKRGKLPKELNDLPNYLPEEEKLEPVGVVARTGQIVAMNSNGKISALDNWYLIDDPNSGKK